MLAQGSSSKRAGGPPFPGKESLRNVRLSQAHVAGVTGKIFELMDVLSTPPTTGSTITPGTIVPSLVGNFALGDIVKGANEGEVSRCVKDRALPAWASDHRNCRGMMSWDGGQYVAVVGIERRGTEAILDTGGANSLMDMGMADRLGLAY